jgi:hypothetical protein
MGAKREALDRYGDFEGSMGGSYMDVCDDGDRFSRHAVLEAAEQDERGLRESLAKCRTSNEALAQQASDLEAKLAAVEAECDRLRTICNARAGIVRDLADVLTVGTVGNPTGDSAETAAVGSPRGIREVRQPPSPIENSEAPSNRREGGEPARLHSRPGRGAAPMGASKEGDAFAVDDGADSLRRGRVV